MKRVGLLILGAVSLVEFLLILYGGQHLLAESEHNRFCAKMVGLAAYINHLRFKYPEVDWEELYWKEEQHPRGLALDMGVRIHTVPAELRKGRLTDINFVVESDGKSGLLLPVTVLSDGQVSQRRWEEFVKGE